MERRECFAFYLLYWPSCRDRNKATNRCPNNMQMLRRIAHSVLLSIAEFLRNFGRKTISFFCFQFIKLKFSCSVILILH